jgi:hypothetical protein
MHRISSVLKQVTVFGLSLLLLAASPMSVFAAEDPGTPTDPGTTQTTPVDPSALPTTPPATPDPAPAPAPTPAPTPAPSTPGPQKPNGADGSTYVFNSATGMWENDLYIWNPVTKQTTPKNAPTYSFNPATGHWDTTQWVYDPAAAKYVPNVVSVAAPPAGAALLSVNNTGPDSQLNANSTNNNSGIFNNFYNASISNNLLSNAISGNATVSFNTLGGNATSGNALAQAQVLNALQSSIGGLQGNLSTFTLNVNGDVTGDLNFDPGQLGPNSSVNQNAQTNNDLKVNNQQNGNITNNIDLNAVSGDASVNNNTTGGNATSGSANAVAEITNIINSIVGAGKSFMGTININGNLNGDILLPQDMLNSLIAASGPTTTIDTSSLTNNNLNANLNNNSLINNTVHSNATSGNAAVNDNTSGGSATTGSATTNTKINVLNLTGRTVIGKDALLVFVNVLGNWVGMIVNAPAGSTAAALGGNLTSNSTTNNNVDLNSNNNSTINNNLNLNATSGNANVSDNTKGGNATSGNAGTSAEIANIENSNLNLSDWLGILFINVFGTWNGSFGVNTAAGNPAGGKGGGAPAGVSQDVQVFHIAPTTGGSFHVTKKASTKDLAPQGNAGNSNTTKVLATSIKTNPPASSQPSSVNAFSIIMVALGVLGFAWIFSSTEAARKSWSKRGVVTKPVGHALHVAGTRLLTFLF